MLLPGHHRAGAAPSDVASFSRQREAGRNLQVVHDGVPGTGCCDEAGGHAARARTRGSAHTVDIRAAAAENFVYHMSR